MGERGGGGYGVHNRTQKEAIRPKLKGNVESRPQGVCCLGGERKKKGKGHGGLALMKRARPGRMVGKSCHALGEKGVVPIRLIRRGGKVSSGKRFPPKREMKLGPGGKEKKKKNALSTFAGLVKTIRGTAPSLAACRKKKKKKKRKAVIEKWSSLKRRASAKSCKELIMTASLRRVGNALRSPRGEKRREKKNCSKRRMRGNSSHHKKGKGGRSTPAFSWGRGGRWFYRSFEINPSQKRGEEGH